MENQGKNASLSHTSNARQGRSVWETARGAHAWMSDAANTQPVLWQQREGDIKWTAQHELQTFATGKCTPTDIAQRM